MHRATARRNWLAHPPLTRHLLGRTPGYRAAATSAEDLEEAEGLSPTSRVPEGLDPTPVAAVTAGGAR